MSLFRGLTEDAAWFHPSLLPSLPMAPYCLCSRGQNPRHGAGQPIRWASAHLLALPASLSPSLTLRQQQELPCCSYNAPGVKGLCICCWFSKDLSSPSVLLSPVGFLLETYPGFRKVTLSHSFSILLLFYFSPWHLSLPIYYICFTYLFIICFPTGASGQRFLSLWLITASQYLEQHPAQSRCSVSICEICTSFIHSSFI